MNYSEIVDLAISYSDRDSDLELPNHMDNFLKIVESRVNRKLKTLDMSTRLAIPAIDDQEFYDLPTDFGGLREIKLTNSSGSDTVINYSTPQLMDGLQGVDTVKIYYTIVGKQIRVSPTQTTGDDIYITYFKKVPELTSLNTTNWLGDYNPDCYVFGLLVEISSFAKDADAKILWDDRFTDSLGEIQNEDDVNRWSGPPLETRIG